MYEIIWTRHKLHPTVENHENTGFTKEGGLQQHTKTRYLVYIRAKLDCGSTMYATACYTTLKKLNKMQNAALILILGACGSSPIVALEAEAYIPPSNP